MGSKRKILIAYENREHADKFVSFLDREQYEVIMTSSVVETELLAESHCPDIIMLGLLLEDGSGMHVLKSIRRWSDAAVVVVSSSRSEAYMLEALDSGADDYIRTPCSIDVLLARMRLAIRHYDAACGSKAGVAQLRIGELVVDSSERRVYIGGCDAKLTNNEYRIVAYLVRHSGKICTYREIITHLWGPNADSRNEILRVNMNKIRKKLKDDATNPRYIFTVPKIGYRMSEK